jgi:CTD kinase subunit beta
VACKQEDTLKKLRDILVAGYTLRHPNGPDINPESQVPLVDMCISRQTLEDQRRKIIILERHVLETATFDFRTQHPQPYIIKFTKHMNCSPFRAGKSN